MESMVQFSLRKIDENKELPRFVFPSQAEGVTSLKRFLQSSTSFIGRIMLKSIEATIFFIKMMLLFCSVHSVLSGNNTLFKNCL